MKSLLMVLSLVFAFNASAVTYCNPAKSRPCGKGCVSLDKSCTKNWSTSIAGINPDSGGKKHYEASEVKHVDKAPSK